MSGRQTRRALLKVAGASAAAWTVGCAERFGAWRPGGERAARGGVVPRAVPEGTVPLVAVEGTAYECGQAYGRLVVERYPGYRRYLDPALEWRSLPGEVRRLFERRAPYVPEIYRGLLDAAGPPGRRPVGAAAAPGAAAGGCTSFGVSGEVTLDGEPMSGQTKDTVRDSALLYVVLRMRIAGGPTILVLAYPGEVLGYGLWSTGMSLFRNSLFSRGGAGRGLPMEQWGMLALAGQSVDEAADLACRCGLSTVGSFLISDAAGESVSVESNAGGVSVVPARRGICTHANHPVGEKTAPLEDYPSLIEKENSRYRMARLWELLDGQRGRLTAPQAMAFLAEHSRYPTGGLCRHLYDGEPTWCTTAAVVAEPARGRLHVTRGNPCCNWPVTYTI